MLSIRRMRQLQSLSLQSCVRLTNSSLAAVAELTNLRSLNIRGCLQVGLPDGASSDAPSDLSKQP